MQKKTFEEIEPIEFKRRLRIQEAFDKVQSAYDDFSSDFSKNTDSLSFSGIDLDFVHLDPNIDIDGQLVDIVLEHLDSKNQIDSDTKRTLKRRLHG